MRDCACIAAKSSSSKPHHRLRTALAATETRGVPVQPLRPMPPTQPSRVQASYKNLFFHVTWLFCLAKLIDAEPISCSESEISPIPIIPQWLFLQTTATAHGAPSNRLAIQLHLITHSLAGQTNVGHHGSSREQKQNQKFRHCLSVNY